MSARQIHVWREWAKGRGPQDWNSWCRRMVAAEQQDSRLGWENLRDATCLDCLKALRDCKMREAEERSRIARQASEAYDAELNRRRRR